MDDHRNERYLYQAGAVGFSAYLRRPFEEIIEAQATAALPGSGGFAHASARHFHHKGLFSFESAHTVITGGEGAGHFDTVISTTVARLNILDMVTADRVVARMTIYRESKDRPAQFSPLGSHFEGLRIAGHPVSVKLDCGVEKPEYEGLCRWLQKDPSKGSHLAPLATADFSDSPEFQTRFPGCEARKNAIKIPHFGTVYLAEYAISPYARRLTMLRVKLGCAYDGEVTCCGIDGGGPDAPPDGQ